MGAVRDGDGRGYRETKKKTNVREALTRISDDGGLPATMGYDHLSSLHLGCNMKILKERRAGGGKGAREGERAYVLICLRDPNHFVFLVITKIQKNRFFLNLNNSRVS